MHRRTFISLLLFSFCFIANSQSRNLDFYINEGLRNSPLLNDYRNQIKSASSDSLLVRAAKKPLIEANSQLQTIVERNVIGSILEKEQMTDIRMIYPGSTSNSLGNTRSEFIFMPDGKLKPLSGLSEIRLKEGVAEINRDNLKLVSIVTARLNNRDLGSAIKEIQKITGSKNFLPQGYHIEYGGEYTALGAIIALTPLAVGAGSGAQMHQPLAIAVIGGFLVALPLLLIIFPVLLNLDYGREK